MKLFRKKKRFEDMELSEIEKIRRDLEQIKNDNLIEFLEEMNVDYNLEVIYNEEKDKVDIELTYELTKKQMDKLRKNKN